jgi:hypothetical protein
MAADARALWKKNLLCVLTPCGAATVGGTSKALGSGYSADSPVPRYFDLLDVDGLRKAYARGPKFSSPVEKRPFMTAIQLSFAFSDT